MSEKTFNTGRVVGWSAYEEFIRQTGTDPSVVSSYVYQTLVTYGVSRRVELTVNGWSISNGGQFYTQTIEVPGASWGAVPIIGLDYESYMDFFLNPGSSTESVEVKDTFEKSTLEQAIGKIFSVYVSDASGNKTENSLDDHGYLTFVAYPDVLGFMAEMPGESLKLIVRGLSMENLGDVDNLYYGPQGLLFGGNGLSESCTHSTENMNNLSLNSAGYLWLSVGGQCSPADYRGLVSHPQGSILTSTFGYLSKDMLNGTGEYVGSTYALTYKEYLDGLGASDIAKFDVQVNAIPELERDNYMYLVSGLPSYTDYPPTANPFFILPVNKETGKVNVGAIAGWELPKMKKLIDFTRTSGSDDTAVLYLYDKMLPEYIGTWWTYSLPVSFGLNYSGSNSLTMPTSWIGNDLTADSGTFHETGRQASWKIIGGTQRKGNLYVVYGQTNPRANGLYLCTIDPDHEEVDYTQLNRLGGYLGWSAPDWVISRDTTPTVYEIDLTSFSPTIDNGVLLISGSPIYPGEPLALGLPESQRIVYVENTIVSGQPRLIVRNEVDCKPTVTFDGTASTNIVSVSDLHSNILSIARATWNASYAGRVLDSYTDSTTHASFTVTNTEVTPGSYISMSHQKSDTYGYNKTYEYVVLRVDVNNVVLASSMVLIDNPNLLATVGIAGEQNSSIPRYKQDIPNASGSYYYNVNAALNKITARAFFDDFGWDISDYVDADFQNLSLGQFLRECVIRNDLSVPKSPDTNRGSGMNVTFHLYTKEELGIEPLPSPDPSDPGRVYCKMPQPSPEIDSQMTLSATTRPISFFDTAFYTAIDSSGAVRNINNPDYPIWVTIGKSKFGPQVMSESLIDGDGARLDFSGNGGSIESDKITWLDLLIALGTGRNLDILKGLAVRRTESNQNCIVGADGTKLVLSSTEPDPEDFEVGTLGIGW